MRRLVAAVMLAALGASGCGYALAGQGDFLPADIRTVGIPALENATTFFDVEQVLTEKIRAEFIGRGRYEVTTGAAGSDAVLTGTITSIGVQPTGLSDRQLASRYLFTVSMQVAFTDARTDEVLWSNTALTYSDEYELSTAVGVAIEGGAFLDQERNAFDRISDDVARAVVTAILEAF
jgi:curli biogenesis system outer membrane secretion channel CsgG